MDFVGFDNVVFLLRNELGQNKIGGGALGRMSLFCLCPQIGMSRFQPENPFIRDVSCILTFPTSDCSFVWVSFALVASCLFCGMNCGKNEIARCSTAGLAQGSSVDFCDVALFICFSLFANV